MKSKLFDDWLKEIDNEINFTLGISLEELPDFYWWYFYNNRCSPTEALNQFFESGKYDNNEQVLSG